MDPITAVIAEKGMAKLADFAFTLALAGIAREPFVDYVRKREAEGATPDQITDELYVMRQQSEKDTQTKIDALPK